MGWEYIAILLFSTILSIALAPKPAKPEPATLEDFEFPTAEEGTPQIIVFGDVWIDGWMVLAYGNLRTEPIEQGKKGGKK